MAGPPKQQSSKPTTSPTATCSPPNNSRDVQGSPSRRNGSPAARQNPRSPAMSEASDSEEHDDFSSDSASTSSHAGSDSTSASAPPQEMPVLLRQEWNEIEIDSIILQNMEPDGIDVATAYKAAGRMPPVTTETLAELDMTRIINNPKLRHDVNFDRELHFRPNLDGSKGKRKLRAANVYWLAVSGELFMFRFASEMRSQTDDPDDIIYWERVIRASPCRLKPIFETVRDILKTLVPDEEQQAIEDRLDVDLMMQEIVNGVCDLINLSKWLAMVLKEHCAPMRDEQVDQMQQAIDFGATYSSDDKLGDGLRQLLTILEAMKLDVANHQIRHMRSLLIGDTINFEQKYNAHRVDTGKIEVQKTLDWLRAAPLKAGAVEASPLQKLSTALLHDLIFQEQFETPPTFYLDTERLVSIRVDIHRAIGYKLCRKVLAEHVADSVLQEDLSQGQKELECAIAATVGTATNLIDRVEHIAVEVVRMLQWLERRYSTFDGSMLPEIEQHLRAVLSSTSDDAKELIRAAYESLLPKLLASVEDHVRLSAIDLEILIPSPPMQLAVGPSGGMGAVLMPVLPEQHSSLDVDVIKRLTHVICIHWQVWADLVYLKPSSDNDATLISPNVSQDGYTAGRTSPSPSSNTKAPIAQAVFRPGHKLLPSELLIIEANEVGQIENEASTEDQPDEDGEQRHSP